MSETPEHDPQDDTIPLSPEQRSQRRGPARSDESAVLRLERLGEFRLLSLIGQGGMGSVYLAEQDNPARKVALKLMRLGAENAEAVARFRREGATLARLDHPGIAKIYAAGVAETSLGSLPYFAMELVQGVSLLRHAQASELDQQARLRLMVSVCAAVQHAHQRGVVHRDLKPANILVDAQGHPRVLDFGIARLMDEAEGDTRLTRMGELVGTLPYMSPEQLQGEPESVDTRTDVYALGVVLYELLSGRLPREFDANTSIVQAISKSASLRQIPLSQASPECRGELETIVMKALAEDPAQRYGSASELGADIERFLRHEPVLARAPSAWYVAGKFARRHRALVAASLVTVLALIGSTAFALNAAWKEREARQAAERSAAISQSVQGFMDDMFQAAMPESALGREVSVREVVDQASLLLQNSPPRDPMVAGESALALANVNLALGRYDQAGQLVARAKAVLARVGDEARTTRIDAALLDLRVRAARGDDDKVEADAQALLADTNRQLGPADPHSFEASNLLGEVLMRKSKFEPANVQFHRVLDTPMEVLPADSPARETALANLAVSLRGSGDLKGAAKVLTSLEKDLSARRGAEHPATLSVVNNLAIALQNTGDTEQALALYDRAFAGRSRVLGPDHPETLNVLQNRATLLIQAGKAAEAEPVLRQLLATLRKTRQANHPSVLVAMNSLAYALEDLGKLAEAEQIYRDTLAIQVAAGTAHPETFGTRNNLAMLLMREGKYAAAEQEFKQVIALATEHLGAEHPYVLIFSNNYGECLGKMQRYTQAEALLLSTQAGLAKAMGEDNPRTAKARARLAALYEQMKQPEKAAKWQAVAAK